jgi:tyrosinase
MRVAAIVASLLLGTSVGALTTIQARNDEAADAQLFAALAQSIQADVLKSLDEREAKLRKRGQEATCTSRNVIFRRE